MRWLPLSLFLSFICCGAGQTYPVTGVPVLELVTVDTAMLDFMESNDMSVTQIIRVVFFASILLINFGKSIAKDNVSDTQSTNLIIDQVKQI